ncbi:unnamed protein product [Diamesa serratosioi]
MNLLSVLLFSVWLSTTSSYKILGIFPFGSKSHFAIGKGVMKSLFDAGHEITMVSPYPRNIKIHNWRDISLMTEVQSISIFVYSVYLIKEPLLNAFEFGSMNPVQLIFCLYEMGAVSSNSTLAHPAVQEIINSGETFDAVVVEIFNNDAISGLAQHFNCPLIGVTTFGAVKWANEMTGNQSPFSYVPHPFLSFTDKMSFKERLYNTMMSIVENIGFEFIYIPEQNRIYNNYFPKATKSFKEVLRNPAIVLLNNHVSSSSPRPYLPNMIEIGGIHVDAVKDLPTDLKDYLDSAKDGLIYFSMGSIVQATDWPVAKRKAFIKSFGKLKQKVLWKYENETLPGKTSNIKISSWLPQRDILAHPNVKVFITHGGLLGTTEALVEGVPVLGIPIFGDQKMNMAKAVARGYGLQINYEDVSEELITSKLTELLNNPSYDENAKEISRRFSDHLYRDRPMSAKETAIYWVEYVIKHKGAPHLRYSGADLNFLQYNSLDVISFITLIIVIVLTISIKFFHFLISLVFGKKKNTTVLFLIVISLWLSIANAYKILGVFPLYGKSHFTLGNAVMKTLIDAGHEITMISAFPNKIPQHNYRDISIENEDLEKMKTLSFLFLHHIGSMTARMTLAHPNVQTLMNSGETFDAVIVEAFNFDAIFGLAEYYNCPLIVVTPFGAVKWANVMTGNQSPSSYVPQPFLHYTDKMTFKERLYNTFVSLIEHVAFQFVHIPWQSKIYNEFFPNAKKSFQEVLKSPAIVLLNNYVASSSPRPYLPNMIEIGGVHIDPVKELPKDIKDYLDSAEHGVVYFSMGSVVQSKSWPIEKREALTKAFGKLKQKVLWKYENETLPGNPGNIMIGSWLPQRDILAHPNVKVFITHGGIFGTTEALVEGVPVLGLPIFGDQKMNMAKAATKGYGLKIDYDDISEELITEKLQELLTNPKYYKKAKEISKRYLDRPITPKKAVSFWVEYAIRHNGADHLKAVGNSLNFFQFHLIDVYVTLFLFALILLTINIVIMRKIARKIFSKKAAVKKSKKNK